MDETVGTTDNPAPIEVASGEFFHRAHALYAGLRERGAVARARFQLPEGEEPEPDGPFAEDFWLITRYDEACTVLQDDDRFSVHVDLPEVHAPDDELFTRSLLNTDPPDHTRLRKLVQPWFSGPAMKALAPRIQRITDDLLDAAEADHPDRRMDLVEAFAYPLPVTVISEMLGLPSSDHDQVREWTEELLNRRSRDPDRRRTLEQRKFVEYLRDQVARKRREPADDLISFLVGAEGLDEDELLSLVFLLFVAGHITTVNLIANAVAALLRWPDQMALVRQDLSLVKNLVEETLRYWGPAENTVPRVAREPVRIDGIEVAKGDRVAVSLAAADRDPALFEDPDRFDVTRPNAKRHIAFGRGIHTCLGAPLARLEGAIALRTLLERYPDLRCAVPVDALAWKAIFLRGFREVPVTF